MPFNRAAVELADDAFYAAHPEFHRKNGSRKPRKWCIGLNWTLRSEWYRYYREAKANLRTPATVGPDDNVDPVAIVMQCKDDVVVPFCTPMRSVKLTSVSYINKFLLYNEEEKWTHTGLPYTPLDWTPDMEKPNPIVVHFDNRHAFSMKITYRVEDDDACPETGIIQSVYQPNGTDALSHEMLKDAELSPGKDHTATQQGYQFPPEEIACNPSYGNKSEAIVGPKVFDMGTPKNEIFFTWGKPKERQFLEDGSTLKRMRAAVNLASRAKSVDEFKVIEELFKLFPGYTLGLDHLHPTLREELRKDKDTLKELTAAAWPGYFADDQVEKAGAWLILDHPKYKAECQAICRIIRGIMRQLGAESTIEFRTYTAHFSNPTQALNESCPSGDNPLHHYGLADGDVEVGEIHGLDSSVGFNNFEAYLKVTCPGQPAPRIFGGGIGLLAEETHPLACFKSIVEYKWIKRLQKTGEGDKRAWKWAKLIKAVKKYEKNSFADWDGYLP